MTRIFHKRDEQGIALITAIMVGFIATMFTLTMMYTAFHGQVTSAHNRSWGQALHVAESGVHEAVAYLQNSAGVVPSGTVTGTTEEGTYQYRITAQPRNRYQIDAVGTVGTASSTTGSRRLRVTMAPPISFRYALFSSSDVTTKNNNNVCGDVYANTYVQVYAGDAIRAVDQSELPEREYRGQRQRHGRDRLHRHGQQLDDRGHGVVGRLRLERLRHPPEQRRHDRRRGKGLLVDAGLCRRSGPQQVHDREQRFGRGRGDGTGFDRLERLRN